MTYVNIEDAQPNIGVPKPALALAALLAAATIGLAAVARITHHGVLGEQPRATLVTSRALVFSDRPDGSIGVFDAGARRTLAPLPGGNGGFVRGALRALARQRRLDHVGREIPFYLARWSDGRLTLDDSSTSNHLELQAFGPANAAAFEQLLDERTR